MLVWIYRRIKKLFYWLPILWQDYDSDHAFILIILRHKLQLVKKDLQRDFWVGADKEARNVHIALLHLDRLIERDYHENVYLHHDRKWGKIMNWTTPLEDGSVNCWFRACNATTPELEKQERKEYRQLMELPDKMKQQDLDALCVILRKHLFKWWS